MLSPQTQLALQKLDYLLSYAKPPLVDVVVVNYNYGRYLGDCLESIKKQDYTNWKCVIVDNASTDDSVKVANNFCQENPDKFRLIESKENLGQMGAMKLGLGSTRGEFVVFVDADDMLLPNAFSLHVASHLYKHPVAFSSGKLATVNDKGMVVEGSSSAEMDMVRQYKYYAPVHWSLRHNLRSPTTGLMFRSSVAKLIITKRACVYNVCADSYLVRFAGLLGGHLFFPEYVGLYRRHQNNQWATPIVLGAGAPHTDPKQSLDFTELRRTIADELFSQARLFGNLLTIQGFIWRYLAVAQGTQKRKILELSGHLEFSEKNLKKELFKGCLKNNILYSVSILGSTLGWLRGAIHAMSYIIWTTVNKH